MRWLPPLIVTLFLGVTISAEVIDVVVVGGGLAGLAAAKEYTSLRPDHTLVLLEAKDRLGGRIHAVDMFTKNGTERIDIGAQWISPSHADLIQLVRSLGLTLESQTSCGERKVFVEDEDSTKRVERSVLDSVVPFDQIVQAAHLQKYAGQSVKDWIESANLTANEVNIVHRILQTVLDAPESSISALHVLLLASSEGRTLGEVLAGNGHGEGLRVAEGLAEVVDKFSSGVDARLNEPVLSVIREENGTVTVRTVKGEYQARQVIIAVPPSIAASIHFVPALPHSMQQFMQSYVPVGHAVHFAVTYNHPWWRANNISGETVYGSKAGPLTWMTTFDTGRASECGSCGSSSGVLYGMAHFSSHLPSGKRREAIVKALGQTMVFADAEEDVIDYKDYQYSHDEHLGGTVGVLPPSSDLSAVLMINDTISHGPVHFASAELSRVSLGTMNGALLSGKQAAHVVDGVVDKKVVEDESPEVDVARNPLYDSAQIPSLSDLLSVSPSPSLGVTAFKQETTVAGGETQEAQPEVEESVDAPRVETALHDQPVVATTPFDYSTSTFYPPTTTTEHPMDSTTAFAWGPGDFDYHTSTQYPTGVAVGGAAPITEKGKDPAAAEFQQDAAPEVAESHDAPAAGAAGAADKDEDDLVPFVEQGFEYKKNETAFDYHTSTQYPPTVVPVPVPVGTVAPGGFDYHTSTQYPATVKPGIVEEEEGPAKMAVLKNEEMVPVVPEDISGEIRQSSGAPFDYHTSTQYPPTASTTAPAPLVHFSVGNAPEKTNEGEGGAAFSVDEPAVHSDAKPNEAAVHRDQVMEGSGEEGAVSPVASAQSTVDHAALAKSAMQTLEEEVPKLNKEDSAGIGDRLLALLHKILAMLKGE